MARSLWLTSSLFTSVLALPWFGPQETISATATADWSPAPTDGAHSLLKRLVYPVNFCGVQGPEYQNVYCSSGYSCAWFTDYSIVGCCTSGGSCEVYTSCIDGDHPPQSVSYPGIYTCTKSTDFCYLNKYPDGYSQYGCGTTNVGETVLTSWPGINTQYSIQVIYTGGVLEAETPVTLIRGSAAATSSAVVTTPTAAASSAVVVTPSTMATPTVSGTRTEVVIPSTAASLSTVANPPVTASSPTMASSFASSSSSTSPPSTISSTISTSSSTPSTLPTSAPVPQNSSKGLSTGAKIAIGVVISVVGLAAVALILFFCFRRFKRNRDMDRAGPFVFAVNPHPAIPEPDYDPGLYAGTNYRVREAGDRY